MYQWAGQFIFGSHGEYAVAGRGDYFGRMVVARKKAERRVRALQGYLELDELLGAGLVAAVVIAVTGVIAALGDTLFPASSLAQGMAADIAPAANFLVRLRVLHPVLAACGGIYSGSRGASRCAEQRGPGDAKSWVWPCGSRADSGCPGSG